jgi:hypothetical protein
MNGELHDMDDLTHEKSPYTHYTGVMVCPRASLNAVRNRKIEHDFSVVLPNLLSTMTELS